MRLAPERSRSCVFSPRRFIPSNDRGSARVLALRRPIADRGQRECRFSAARFANYPQDSAARQLTSTRLHCDRGRSIGLRLADGQPAVTSASSITSSLGVTTVVAFQISGAPRRRSKVKLTQNTAMPTAGAIVAHGLVTTNSCDSATIKSPVRAGRLGSKAQKAQGSDKNDAICHRETVRRDDRAGRIRQNLSPQNSTRALAPSLGCRDVILRYNGLRRTANQAADTRYEHGGDNDQHNRRTRPSRRDHNERDQQNRQRQQDVEHSSQPRCLTHPCDRRPAGRVRRR